MAAARSSPAQEPAKSQLRRPTATPRSTLGDVVVDLQATIAQEARQGRPAFGAISDSPGHVGLGRQAAKGGVEHLAQVIVTGGSE